MPVTGQQGPERTDDKDGLPHHGPLRLPHLSQDPKAGWSQHPVLSPKSRAVRHMSKCEGTGPPAATEGRVTSWQPLPGWSSGNVSSVQEAQEEERTGSLPGVSGGDSCLALVKRLLFRALVLEGNRGEGRARGGPLERKAKKKCSSAFPPGPQSSVLEHYVGKRLVGQRSPQSGNSTDRARNRGGSGSPGWGGESAEAWPGQSLGSRAVLRSDTQPRLHRAPGPPHWSRGSHRGRPVEALTRGSWLRLA